MRQELKQKLFTALLGDITPAQEHNPTKEGLESVVLKDLDIIESVLDADRQLLGDLLTEFLSKAPCEETVGMTRREKYSETPLNRDEHLRCGNPSIAIVKTRDRRPYAMCIRCTWHNIDNRGGRLVFTLDDSIEERYGGR